MTHTHHRRGDRASLEKDYVIRYMLDPAVQAQQEYGGPIGDRVERLLDACLGHDPVAIAAKTPEKDMRYLKGWEPRMDSGAHTSATLEEIAGKRDLLYEGLGHTVYTNKDDMKAALEYLKEADTGYSIVVSGIFDEVFEACREIGIEPHTVNMSLGTWGRTELLPESPLLEIVTMCGHALVSTHLVESLMDKVRKGSMTPEDAAVELGKQCSCNIFNTERAAELIRNECS